MKTKMMALLATSLLSVSAFAAAGAACCHQNPSGCAGDDCCNHK